MDLYQIHIILHKNHLLCLMNIYDKNGWLDVPRIVQLADRNKINFIFIIGARRTGKTYGIFQHFINDVFSKNEKKGLTTRI